MAASAAHAAPFAFDDFTTYTTETLLDGQSHGDSMFASFDLTSSQGDEQIAVWVDPSSEADPALLSGSRDVLNPGETGFSSLTLVVVDTDYDGFTVSSLRLGSAFAEVAPTPEPSTALLVAFGLAALGVRRGRRAR